MISKNRRIVESWYTSLKAGDLETFEQIHSEDIIYDISGHSNISGRHLGRKKWFEQLAGQVMGSLHPEDFDFCTKFRIIAEDGDTLVGMMEADGPTKTGERYDQRYLHVFYLTDGVITRVIEFFDTELAAKTVLAACKPVPPDAPFGFE